MIPGRVNKFQVVPTETGDFKGKCAELCGAYHSQMLFNVKVVDQADLRRSTSPSSRPQGNTGQLDNSLSRQQGHGRGPSTSFRVQGATDMSSGHRVDRGRTAAPPRPRRRAGSPRAQTVVKWVTTTDHKVIGNLYFITSFIFFMFGGMLALLIRAELFQPGPAGRGQPRAVQPAVHDARHDHAAAVRDAAVRRLRQRAHADADRRARRRLPAAEHVRLLAVPVRRPHRLAPASSPRRVRRRSAGSPTRRCPTPPTAPASAATCGSSASRSVVSAPSSVPSTSSPRSSACARPA